MPLYDDFVDARSVSPERSGILQLSRSIQHLVGITPVTVTRPGNERTFTVRCELGTIRVRPDDYAGRTFVPADVNTGTDEITLTAHGLLTGQGPFQFTGQGPSMVAGTSLTIRGDLDEYQRATGSWITDGFVAGMSILTTGSNNNDGVYTLGTVTALSMDIVEDIVTGEGPSTDFDVEQNTVPPAPLVAVTDYWVIVVDANTIKMALSLADALNGVAITLSAQGTGDTESLGGPKGWAANAIAVASKTDGYGSIAVTAGEEISFAAPEAITLVGMGATDACSYWWSR